MSKQYYNEITILKAIAALFITWFHFKWTVPEQISMLFIGGAIGNSLFFWCSGYLLSFKEERYPGEWMLKKYLRIMPSVWVMYLLMIVMNVVRGLDIHENWQHWLYPTDYWFVNSILAFFLVVAVCHHWIDATIGDKTKQKRNLLILGGSSAILFVLWYIFFETEKQTIVLDIGQVQHCFFICFFLWGYYTRNYCDKLKASHSAWLEAMLSLGLFYGYKKLATPWMVECQVIFVPLLLAYVIYAYRRLAKTLVTYELPGIVKTILMFLSSITLEIYIVQMYFICWIMPLLPFPVNIIVSLMCIFVLAYVVHLVATWVTSKLLFQK